MDAFEEIVKLLLEKKGYWVRQGVKVRITKADKIALASPTMPRPEIDLVAFNPKRDELALIEVKSYLDSYGVYFEAVCTETDKLSTRYRLFTDSTYRDIVSKRVREQLMEEGLVLPSTVLRYGLAAGHIHSKREEAAIRVHFSDPGRNWLLITVEDMRTALGELAEQGWEDNAVIQTAKLLLRD
jgi:hypothetical protein